MSGKLSTVLSHMEKHWPKYFALILPITFFKGSTSLTQLPVLLFGTFMLYLAASGLRRAYPLKPTETDKLVQNNKWFVAVFAISGLGFFVYSNGMSLAELMEADWLNNFISTGPENMAVFGRAEKAGDSNLLISAASYMEVFIYAAIVLLLVGAFLRKNK